MDKNPDQFELDFKGSRLKVQKHSIGNQVVFLIQFPDKKQPLIITRATHSEAYKFWTSVPEGRQEEAEEIGPLISEYFKTVL